MRGSKPGERRGGRKPGVPNKANRDLRELAQAYTKEAVEKLASIMRNGESEQAQVIAARELLDRGHGKSTQPLTGDKNAPLTVQLVQFEGP